MPLLELPIPNLVRGVSQQPAANRIPGQVEACDNALMHVVSGLAKRKGTQHIARVISGQASVDHVHYIDRDPAERYVVLMGERRVQVFTDEGVEVQVRDPSNNLIARAGRTVPYLNPRIAGGELASDEDFVISGATWLSTVANSVTSYVAGFGPFSFGRFQSATVTTADTVAQVGNAAAASISDIYQVISTFTANQVVAVFAKKSTSAINDFELGLINTTAAIDHTVRFDIASDGVITIGATSDAFTTGHVEDYGDGWYLCWIHVVASGAPAAGQSTIGHARRYRIRFHTNAATPANKNLLLFGARFYNTPQPSAYVYDRPNLFRALSIFDTTLLLNREKVPAMTSADTDGNPSVFFIWVRQGAVASDYTAKVEWATLGLETSASFTFTSGAAQTKTDAEIAEGLRALIDANVDLVATRVGSVIRIVHAVPAVTSAVINVSTTDSIGDRAMVAIGRNVDGFHFVANFSDLPLLLDDGFVVKITSNPERAADDYYVKFLSRVGGTTLTPGYWEEAPRPDVTPVTSTTDGILYELDASTMPQQLVRKQDASGSITGTPGTIYFELGPVAWDDLLVGDEASNPQPAFIGVKINDLFLYRGRLGFLSADVVNLSETNEPFNFWRTTVLDLLDTDPIEVRSGSKEVVNFHAATATAQTALLFSDRQQFQLLGEPVLTPATAQLTPVRTFSNLASAVPVDTGRGVLFARFDGVHCGLLESMLLGDDVSFRVEELTVQAPRYIPDRLRRLAHSSLTGLTAALPENARHLFAHQTFYDDSDSRLQSALHRWIFAEGSQIRGIGFFDADLFLVIQRDDGWSIERMSTTTDTTENDLPIVHLDRRVDESQTTPVYDGGADTTTITLPYTIDASADMRVVDRATGLEVPITGQTSTSVDVHGELTTFYVGEAYSWEVTLSEPVIQEQGPRGIVPRMSRPLDVHLLHLYVSDTAYLECEVSPDLRTSSVEEFSAADLGTGLLIAGAVPIYSGDVSFSIIGRSTELSVKLRNDGPYPVFVQSGRWECLSRARAGTA